MEKVIVIGAGPAGLTAAYELLKRGGCDVTVLEASDCPGGLSRNAEFNGHKIDLGGHRFYTDIDPVRKLWDEVMEDRSDDWLTRPRYSRIYYGGHFIDYPVKLSADMLKAVGLKNAMKISISYAGALLRKRDETNLENLYINQFGKTLYRMFFKDYTIKACGADPSEISASWGRKRVKKLSIKKIAESEIMHKSDDPFPDTEGFQYPRYGAGELWEMLAERIIDMGGKIVYGSKVEKIFTAPGRVSYLLAAEGGKTAAYHADWYISSMALKDLGIAFSQIPDDIGKEMISLPYRDFVTFAVQIPKEKFLWGSKDTWIYIQQKGIEMGRIQIYNNWSPDMVDDSESIMIGAEYFCFENDRFWSMDEDKAFRFVAEELVKLGIIRSTNDITAMHRERLKKAYPGYYGSYDSLPEIRNYLSSFENLICIGRNGLHSYLNMDEAMLSGMKAAEYIEKAD